MGWTEDGRLLICSLRPSFLLLSLLALSFVFGVAHPSKFPGTIPATASQSGSLQDWWQLSADAVSPGGSSDSEEGESSSDWEWDEIGLQGVQPEVPTEEKQPKSSPHIDEISATGKHIPSGPLSQPIPEHLPRKASSTNNPSNRPLKTIEKLQQMLDETDYMTTARRNGQPAVKQPPPPAEEPMSSAARNGGLPTQRTNASLWTSKDRSKYKKQQRKQGELEVTSSTHARESTAEASLPPQHIYPYSDPHRLEEYQQYRIREQRRQMQQRKQQQQQQRPPSRPSDALEAAVASDAEEASDTDDGLGYSLPNLPVYLSDGEGDSDQESLPGATTGNIHSSTSGPSSPYEYVSATPPANHASSVQASGLPHVLQQPSPPLPHQQQQQQYQQHQQSVRTDWPMQPPYPYYYPRQFVSRVGSSVPGRYKSENGSNRVTANYAAPGDNEYRQPYDVPPFYSAPTFHVPKFPGDTAEYLPPEAETKVTKPRGNQRLSFASVAKLSTCTLLSAVVCYSAVSPRNVPMVVYNQKFYQNLRIASLTTIPPLILSAFVVDMGENDVNQLVSAFTNAFTIGYILTFLSEILAATWIRLAVFSWWERDVFSLSPKVPLLVVPWVLREQKYRVKPITLLVQDFITSAVVCPMIEEFVKLAVLRQTVVLPRNFDWITKRSKNSNKRRRKAEPVGRARPEDEDVTKVNSYVSNMLAVSVGLKLADSIRRVCMYTRPGDKDKGFYAVCRGIFPIHELCGTVTALSLARRDVLGQRTPIWKLLLPSVIIHGMANFRGMKPIFKWNAATPWSEMQLSPRFETNGASFRQIAAKAFPKVMWLVILCRVAGYCVKNYYMINRQAVRRTTTYAGNHAGFSAELAATEMLKGKKKNNAMGNK